MLLRRPPATLMLLTTPRSEGRGSLFVQEDRFDEVVNGVAEIAKGIKLGPGMDSGTQMGPLVSEEQLQRVTGFLDSGREDGATTFTGGGRFGDHGYFVEPTVITNTRPEMKIVREGIFGPVVVAAEANNSEKGYSVNRTSRKILVCLAAMTTASSGLFSSGPLK